MRREMNAAFLTAPRKYEIRQVPVPAIGPEDLLIRVDACGVCTSDSYHWFGSKNSYPFAAGAPGHETCGTVEAVGSGVTNFKPGQRVAAITFPGFGYAQYVRAEARYTVPLDESFGDQPVLGEPLACAVNAMRRSGVRPGDCVLLLGTGYMGAQALQLLRLMGAAPLIAADIRSSGRALATRLGADIVLDSSAPDFNEQVLALTDGRGAAVVVEATGSQSALDVATQVIRIKGTLVIFGYHVGAPRTIDMRLWNWKGIDVINGHERDSAIYTEGMRYGLKLLKYGKISNDLISHRFPLTEIEQAFALFETRPENYVKSVIRPNE